jgi:LCP family protein required for cell wall assembly
MPVRVRRPLRSKVMSDLEPPRPHGRLARAFVAVTASLSLLIALGIGYGAVRWFQLREGDIVFYAATPEVSSGSAPPEYPTGSCSERPCNYLILGSDSREGLSEEEQEQFGTDDDIGGENRADTIMLVHTDPDREKSVILSFPRDLWVDVHGRGFDKINSAFEGGIDGDGPEVMAKTVANLTGLKIDHFLYVDLAGFQRIVDELGGVNLCVPGYNADPETGRLQDELTGLDIAPGCQTLGGDQSLAYVRTRHLPCDATAPDFYRIQRQQQFLAAVIHQMLEPANLVQAPFTLPTIVTSLERDQEFPLGDLVHLVGQLQGLAGGSAGSVADFRTVPGVSGWEGSLSVVHMDDSAQEIFDAIREGSEVTDVGRELVYTPPSEPNVRVAVIDADSAGLAERVREEILATAGFDVSPGIWGAHEVPKGVEGAAAIIYAPGSDPAASVLSKYLPGVKVVESPRLEGVDVAVVITDAYEFADPGDSGGGGAAAECPTVTI